MTHDKPEPTPLRNGLAMPTEAADEAAAFLEKQLEAEAPNLDAATRRKLAGMGAAMAKREADEKSRATAPEPEANKVIQLDFWDSGKRAAPNALLRSALFPALHPTQKENSRFINEEKIFSVAGLEVFFKGEQFDQSDLDVYLELLNFARPYPLGTPVRFSAYALLKALNLNTGGKEHKRLHSVMLRLRGGTVEIKDHKKRYFGGLIEGGIRDDSSLNYEITINPKFAVLFGFGMWTTIDNAQRHALGRSATAKALHAYYSSHVAPSAHRYETLADIAGLANSNKRQRRADIIKAHERIKAAGFLSGYDAQA